MIHNIEENLWDSIYNSCDLSLLYHSRAHSISGWNKPGTTFFVKREDESGFGISGYKKRKYASLIPFIIQNGIFKAILIGGAYSNHVPGLTQLLREHQLNIHAFIKAPKNNILQGNLFLTNLLLKKDEITWVSKEDWASVPALAEEYATKEEKYSYVIPEGGACSPSFAGACTLMEDIIQNEKECATTFDHIFIDAGTGYTAAVSIWLNHILKRKSVIHVILMADPEDSFYKVLEQVRRTAIEQLQIPLPSTSEHFYAYRPFTAVSFGSINRQVLEASKEIALSTGILTDPVYSTKLFMNARRIVEENNLEGNILIIHSGGGTGLMGFARQYEKILK